MPTAETSIMLKFSTATKEQNTNSVVSKCHPVEEKHSLQNHNEFRIKTKDYL